MKHTPLTAKLAALLIALGALSTGLRAVLITNFGTPAATYDTIISNFPTWSQTATTLNVQGNTTHMFGVLFSSVNISGYTSIQLTAQVNGTNPNVHIQLELYDSSFRSIFFDSYTDLYGPTPTTVTLVYNPGPSDPFFDPTDVIAFLYTGGGAGESLNMTFHDISFTPIPEPGVVGAVALALGLLTLLVRHQLRSAQKLKTA